MKFEIKDFVPTPKDEPNYYDRRFCPSCGINPANNCNYLEETNNSDGYDFNCLAPDEVDLCDNCHHLYCDKCKENK